MQTLRILHLVAPGPAGGAETVIRSLARAQRERGTDAQVGAVLEPDPLDHPFVAGLVRDAVPVHPLRIPPRGYVAELRALYRIARQVRPDIVHTHGARADVLGGLAARLARCPQVSTAHGFTGGDGKNRLYERLQLLSYRRCGAVVAVSRPLQQELQRRGLQGTPVPLVRNAWAGGLPPLTREAARNRLRIPQGERCFGWVGRLSHEKGLDVALAALALVREEEVTLAIVGDGRELGSLQEQVSRLGVAHRVHFCGAVPDAGACFPAFDALVLSSRTEGTPMVLFEAMATDVPIISARVGGIPDMLPDDTALLVPAEDATALAAAMTFAAAHPDVMAAHASRARARLASTFDVDSWVAGYNAVYADVLAARSR